MNLRSISFYLALLVIPACATAAPDERIAYVLAHPHGWVELSIADPSVPNVPSGDESEDEWVRPSHCSISIEVNGEPWFFAAGYPQGEHAPYSVDSGFRFPVPIGHTSIEMSYGGCRIEADQPTSVTSQAEFQAEERFTHGLAFDGIGLSVSPPTPDAVVTLEDVYEAITGERSPAE